MPLRPGHRFLPVHFTSTSTLTTCSTNCQHGIRPAERPCVTVAFVPVFPRRRDRDAVEIPLDVPRNAKFFIGRRHDKSDHRTPTFDSDPYLVDKVYSDKYRDTVNPIDPEDVTCTSDTP